MKSATVIILVGVSGSGKSTLGTAIAAEWGMAFFDGDEFQPPGNIQKMAAGIALQDDDRWPWLNALAAAVCAREPGSGAIVACSALKRIYRDRLRTLIGDPLLFVWLHIPPQLLAERLKHRQGHFMPPTLLESQLEAFEPLGPDEPALELTADESTTAAAASSIIRSAIVA
jgi:carbohydrate kinase (thermoresistant glucokinase family)